MKIKRSLGITRGKNDRVDARRIADYAHTNRARLTAFQLPSVLLIQIKQLLTYRDQQTRIKVSLQNSLQSHKQYQRVSGNNSISEEIHNQISECAKRLHRIDAQIKALIKSDESLKKNFDLARSVKGIGLVISAYMLVTTNNFTSFENGRKFASYSGVAPFENSSGKYRGKTRISHLANKRVKTILSSGANSAIQWDPELRAYYNRKMAEGKEHKLVINSIRFKMLNRVFSVVNRGTPYVITYQQKIA